MTRGNLGARRGRGPRAGTQAPSPTLLIYCEGKVTETHYFLDLARKLRATSVDVAPDHGTPKFLVERAVEEKKRRRKQDKDLRDLVCCVFDADDHPYLDEAIIQARDNGILVALSNPCFELWALLHFRDQTAHIDRVPLRRALQGLIPGYDKRLPLDPLVAGQEDATTRAQALTDKHERDGSPDNTNPCTGVWAVVHEITKRKRQT